MGLIIGTTAFAGTISSSTIYRYQLASIEIKTQRPISYIYSTDWLKLYAGNIAIKYGLSEQDYQEMMATITAESGWNISAKNKISIGICEFTVATWKENCLGSIDDSKAQLDCMGKLWSMGQQYRWDEWCMLFGKKNIQCQKRGF